MLTSISNFNVAPPQTHSTSMHTKGLYCTVLSQYTMRQIGDRKSDLIGIGCPLSIHRWPCLSVTCASESISDEMVVASAEETAVCVVTSCISTATAVAMTTFVNVCNQSIMNGQKQRNQWLDFRNSLFGLHTNSLSRSLLYCWQIQTVNWCSHLTYALLQIHSATSVLVRINYILVVDKITTKRIITMGISRTGWTEPRSYCKVPPDCSSSSALGPRYDLKLPTPSDLSKASWRQWP